MNKPSNENFLHSGSTCYIHGCPIGTGGCPQCNQYETYTIGPPADEPKWGWPINFGPTPHKCPVCDGTGKVSRPPHIAGDVVHWSDSGTGPYECQACDGAGVLWR